jgi:hypothetical protein
MSNKTSRAVCLANWARCVQLALFNWAIIPQSREGERRDSENFSALSASAYSTAWLVRVTQKPFTEDPSSEGSNILVWFGSLYVLPSP